MRYLGIGLGAAALLLPGAIAFAQETPPDSRYVSREEYDKMKQEMKQELQAVQSEFKAFREQKAPAGESDLSQDIEDLLKRMKAVEGSADAQRPGTTKFLVTGYSFAGFTAKQGEPSSFMARLNTIFLWKLSDRAFFEGELEYEFTHEGAEVGIEEAQLTYLLTDYMTLGAGKFLTPIGTFGERGHPMWINKLPDFPFFFGNGGLIPEASVGVQVRGPFVAGSTKGNYAFFVANGSTLNTGSGDPAGTLGFENFVDTNYNKEVGGRIGFLPVPELEFGASFMAGKAGPSDVTSSIGDQPYRLYAADVAWQDDSDALGGVLDVRGQWVASRVARTTYDPDHSLGFGPLAFNNKRSGEFLQVSYRPTKAENAFLKNLEGVVRFDVINQPRDAPTPSAVDERRWTLGLDYWLGPSTVVKLAYEWSAETSPPDGSRHWRALLLQFVIGF